MTSLPSRLSYNPKRRIVLTDAIAENEREAFASQCSYGGNPVHKRSPGDYHLEPPASPRPGKTLCDGKAQISKAEAQRLLVEGFQKGMVSKRRSTRGWPQNVWSVSKDMIEVYEAQLENPDKGVYHGYPVPQNDTFRRTILNEWDRR